MRNETGFFVEEKDGVIEYYQVAYQISNNSHETDKLLMINDNYNQIVLTGRYEGINYIDGIEIKYIVDWLI